FLNFVNLGILRHVRGVTVATVGEGGNCALAVNVTLLDKGDAAASGNETRVFVDLAVDDAAFQGEFDGTVWTVGRVATTSKGAGLYGGV
ncbi:hypothetical protein ACI3PL_23775, partial [Lacticaseibacillus paracasei]